MHPSIRSHRRRAGGCWMERLRSPSFPPPSFHFLLRSLGVAPLLSRPPSPIHYRGGTHLPTFPVSREAPTPPTSLSLPPPVSPLRPSILLMGRPKDGVHAVRRGPRRQCWASARQSSSHERARNQGWSSDLPDRTSLAAAASGWRLRLHGHRYLERPRESQDGLTRSITTAVITVEPWRQVFNVTSTGVTLSLN